MRSMLLLPLVALAGCATAPRPLPPPPTAGSVETIRYETSPCFGRCPVYVLTVRSDGTGIFDGRRFTAVQGMRSFTFTPAQYSAFRSTLEPYRPAGELRLAGEACNGRIATDLPSVDVTWTAKGPQSHLYAYLGCDMERNQAMFDALRSAPDALGISELIGSR